jgi:hypothetical protein
MIKANQPDIQAVALEVSSTMLKSTRDHFANGSTVKVVSILTILRFRFYDKLLP